MGSKLILAVDGGPGDRAATDWVAHRARHAPLSARIVTVVDDYPTSFGERSRAADVANARLRSAAPDLPITAEYATGIPFDVLSRIAGDADMIVLGASDPSPIGERLHLGLAARLAGHIACDLVVVPPDWVPSVAPVVVGWDGSDTSEDAVDRAAEEARAAGVPLRIIHSWMPPLVSGADPVGDAELLRLVERNEERDLLNATEAAQSRHPGLAISAQSHLGTPTASLGAIETASLLVVGTHYRSRLAQLIPNITGALVAGRVAVPVLVAGPTVVTPTRKAAAS